MRYDGLSLFGYWSFCSKLVSNVKYEAVVQEYLPVNLPPDYPTCKDYLDFLLDVNDELAISFYVDLDEIFY